MPPETENSQILNLQDIFRSNVGDVSLLGLRVGKCDLMPCFKELCGQFSYYVPNHLNRLKVAALWDDISVNIDELQQNNIPRDIIALIIKRKLSSELYSHEITLKEINYLKKYICTVPDSIVSVKIKEQLIHSMYGYWKHQGLSYTEIKNELTNISSNLRYKNLIFIERLNNFIGKCNKFIRNYPKSDSYYLSATIPGPRGPTKRRLSIK